MDNTTTLEDLAGTTCTCNKLNIGRRSRNLPRLRCPLCAWFDKEGDTKINMMQKLTWGRDYFVTRNKGNLLDELKIMKETKYRFKISAEGKLLLV